MRWGLLLVLSMATGAAIVCACDDLERDGPQRYYIAPDANEPQPNTPNAGDSSAAAEGDASNDAVTDAPEDAAFSNFDPATLTLTGWWRAGFMVSPWKGIASAGTSLGRDLAEATNPPVAATPINGFAPASFDGMNDQLLSVTAVNAYLSTTGWEVHGLISADSARPYAAGMPYAFPAILTDNTAGDFYIAFSSAGVIAGHYDGVSFKEIVAACPTGGIHTFQAWFDGTKLNLSVDNGAPAVPVTTGVPIFGVGALRMGLNYAGAAGFDGNIVEIMIAAKVLDDPSRKGIRAYFNKRYGTAFPL